MDKLEELRTDLDNVDKTIFELLKKRFEITDEIGKYKKEKDIEIFHPKRELEILKTKTQLANKYDVNSKFIEELFQLIMNESKKRQKEIIDNDN